MVENFTCPICKKNDFLDLDYFRIKKENMVLCKECGMVTYKVDQKALENMYKNSDHNAVRKWAGTKDLGTKLHKLVYHRHFLDETLKSKKDMSVLDIGCSTGYLLNMIKTEYGHKDVTGLELNPAHAEMARGEYGIDVYEYGELSEYRKAFPDKKFDLITCFAVLEHMLEPAEKLKEMKAMLKPNGKIYIMTPIWFRDIYNSGYQIQEFEGLFVPHHINVFSDTSRDNCFKLAGLKKTKHSASMYGDIVLLEPCKVDKIIKEDYRSVQTFISKIKKAIEYMMRQNYDAALQEVPAIPDAYRVKALKDCKDNPVEHERLLKMGISCHPYSPALYDDLGQLYIQLLRYDDAIETLKMGIELNPALYPSYFRIAEVYNVNREYEKSNEWIHKLININPQLRDTAFNQDALTPQDLLGLNYYKLSQEK